MLSPERDIHMKSETSIFLSLDLLKTKSPSEISYEKQRRTNIFNRMEVVNRDLPLNEQKKKQ